MVVGSLCGGCTMWWLGHCVVGHHVVGHCVVGHCVVGHCVVGHSVVGALCGGYAMVGNVPNPAHHSNNSYCEESTFWQRFTLFATKCIIKTNIPLSYCFTAFPFYSLNNWRI